MSSAPIATLRAAGHRGYGRLLLVLATALALACPAAAAAKSKKRKPPPLPPQAVLSNTLNEKRDEIQRCAIEHALDRGAKQAEITTKVTINSRGQVIDSKVSVSVNGGDGEKVRECVEKVVRGIQFPKINAPLINIERTWTIAG